MVTIQRDFLCSPLWVLHSSVQDLLNEHDLWLPESSGQWEGLESGMASKSISQVQLTWEMPFECDGRKVSQEFRVCA